MYDILITYQQEKCLMSPTKTGAINSKNSDQSTHSLGYSVHSLWPLSDKTKTGGATLENLEGGEMAVASPAYSS
ncbi:hypothetical protein AALO_G00168240 [Alosa alosa]|uniref:Uncharacterized protein n=1 Tax=Alosa alosa TaxID=278164 RepID=A0AAV6GCK7_9TELE|nr:hypothetical protein AALO_G00168240 [Alosa alosa]